MSPDEVHEAISALKKEGLRDRVTIEISGGISEGSLVRYASEGVDVISIGALTHSVKNISVHLDIIGPAGKQ